MHALSWTVIKRNIFYSSILIDVRQICWWRKLGIFWHWLNQLPPGWTVVLRISWLGNGVICMYNIQQSYHNEHTHFCREMCNVVNTRFLRPFGVITEITTKSPQKLYNGSFFGPFFTQKSFFSPLKSFWPQVLKTRFHLRKHCLYGNDVSGVNKKGLGYSGLQDRILEVKNEN